MQCEWVAAVTHVETNIVIFSVKPNFLDEVIIEKLKSKNIYISSLGKNKLRMVTHLDYKEVMHTYVLETLQKMVF
jgi:threonine aldolase